MGSINCMEHNSGQQNLETILRSLCPNANEDELREAEENLKEYLRVVVRIHDRLQREARMQDQGSALTDMSGVDRMRSKDGDGPV